MDSLAVFLTVDVEMWPPEWDADLAAHQDAFKRYIHGVGKPRSYGLPYQLRVLADHGLKGVFFVEPLFASVVGRGALEEVVGMIRDAGQDVQLHLHPEWLGRAGDPELPGPRRLALKDMSLDEQTWLIGLGRRWLEEAGSGSIRAFRAGSFGANRDTLGGLARNGIYIDFSQSRAGRHGPIDAGVPEDVSMTEEGVTEVPLTTYTDFLGRPRPLQVGSSSYAEARTILGRCLEGGRRSAVMLSHSGELLDDRRTGKDGIVNRRFLRLCRLLERERDVFRTAASDEVASLPVVASGGDPAPLNVAPTTAIGRYAGQLVRRLPRMRA